MNDCVGSATLKVDHTNTARSLKSGLANVLSSSILLGLMEEASVKALSTVSLVCGQNSVGHLITMDHIRPSPIGSHVTAISKITKVDFNGVTFEVEAFDENGLVGKGTHNRVFVDQDDFERRCYDNFRKSIFNK